MTWDGVQREVLEALGYTLWRQVDPGIVDMPDDPLVDALLRAAGRKRDSADAAAVWRALPPLAQLRDPGAKRAVWPRLRAMRRRPPP